MTNILKTTRTILLGASLLAVPLVSNAQTAVQPAAISDYADGQSNAEEILALAKVIAAPETSSMPALRRNVDAKTAARRGLIDILLGRNQDDLDTAMSAAEKADIPHMDIHKVYADLTVKNHTNNDLVAARISDLKAFATSTDWERKNLAYLYLGLHYIFLSDSTDGMEYAQMALDVIPGDDNSLAANDARYDTYDLLHTAFVIDRNQGKAVEATVRLVRYGQELGRRIDKASIIHNMSLLFSKTQDKETAVKLSELSLAIVADQSDWDKSIAHYSHGANLIALQKHAAATPFLEQAAAVFSNERFMFATKCQLALAYARMGESKKANAALQEALNYKKTDDGTVKRMASVIYEAEAYINFHEGRFDKAFEKLEAATHIQVETLENLANTDRRRASRGLAVSQRVADEREARLKSEIGLSESVAQRGYVIGLIASFLAIALAFIAFNINRQRKNQLRINTELAASRDKAMVSERAKSKFLSMMGHELRTPMNPIISLADLLCARSNDAENKHMLKMISSNGRSMLTMVENILIVSDDSERHLKVAYHKTRIREFLRFTTSGFKSDAIDKGLNFSVKVHENVPEFCDIDKLKLRSILGNILGNAVKFTKSGSIDISVNFLDHDEIGRTLLFSIKDTGVGISGSEINRLDAEFELRATSHTAAHDGVGVGLFIAKLFTKAHNGRLNISSHPKDGTRVDVLLPQQALASQQVAA